MRREPVGCSVGGSDGSHLRDRSQRTQRVQVYVKQKDVILGLKKSYLRLASFNKVQRKFRQDAIVNDEDEPEESEEAVRAKAEFQQWWMRSCENGLDASSMCCEIVKRHL